MRIIKELPEGRKWNFPVHLILSTSRIHRECENAQLMLNFSSTATAFIFRSSGSHGALTFQNNSEYHYFRQQCKSIFIHFSGGNFWFFLLLRGQIFPPFSCDNIFLQLRLRLKLFPVHSTLMHSRNACRHINKFSFRTSLPSHIFKLSFMRIALFSRASDKNVLCNPRWCDRNPLKSSARKDFPLAFIFSQL